MIVDGRQLELVEVRVEARVKVPVEDQARAREVLLSHVARGRSEILAGALSSAPTIRELLPDFLLAARAERGALPQSLAAYRRRLLRFAVDLSNAAGDVALDRIRAADLHRWIDARLREPGRRGETLARSTCAADVRSLQTFARWAIAAGRVSADLPLLHVRVRAPKRRNGAGVCWASVAEMVGLLRRVDEFNPYLAAVIWAMLHFGRRPSAICGLRRRDVRLPGPVGAGVGAGRRVAGVARFRSLKKGEPGEVVLPAGSERAKDILHGMDLFRKRWGRMPKPNEPIFPARAGRGRLSSSNPTGWTAWSVAHEVARLRDQGVLPAGFTVYWARHSAATWLKQRGLHPTAVRHYLGHKAQSTQAVYDHTSGVDAEPGYAAIEEILQGAASDSWLAAEAARVRASNASDVCLGVDEPGLLIVEE